MDLLTVSSLSTLQYEFFLNEIFAKVHIEEEPRPTGTFLMLQSVGCTFVFLESVGFSSSEVLQSKVTFLHLWQR